MSHIPTGKLVAGVKTHPSLALDVDDEYILEESHYRQASAIPPSASQTAISLANYLIRPGPRDGQSMSRTATGMTSGFLPFPGMYR